MVVFAKEPRPGRVKTRLAKGIGTVAAARWFRGAALDLVRRLARERRWEVVIAVSPDREGLESRVWPRGVRRRAQGRGERGRRMARARRGGRAPGEGRPGPVAVVGADVPGISAVRVAEAFAALGRADAVFGPAEDGGFWLVGLKRVRAPAAEGAMFAGVRWSRETTLAETLGAFRGLRGGFCATLRDVDEAADLRDGAR